MLVSEKIKESCVWISYRMEWIFRKGKERWVSAVCFPGQLSLWVPRKGCGSGSWGELGDWRLEDWVTWFPGEGEAERAGRGGGDEDLHLAQQCHWQEMTLYFNFIDFVFFCSNFCVLFCFFTWFAFFLVSPQVPTLFCPKLFFYQEIYHSFSCPSKPLVTVI